MRKHKGPNEADEPIANDEATEIPIEHEAIFNRAETVTERYALLQTAAQLYPAFRGSHKTTGQDYAAAVEAAAALLDAVDAHIKAPPAAAGDPAAAEQ